MHYRMTLYVSIVKSFSERDYTIAQDVDQCASDPRTIDHCTTSNYMPYFFRYVLRSCPLQIVCVPLRIYFNLLLFKYTNIYLVLFPVLPGVCAVYVYL